jgi:DNA-binding HxlR family transcriptional regulator
MTLKPDIKVMRMIKALDSSTRMQIVNLIVNTSPTSFTSIQEHMETVTGKAISKGTLAYHLDILVQGNILRRELSQNPDRTYSSYDTTEEARKTLTALGILIEQKQKEPATPSEN